MQGLDSYVFLSGGVRGASVIKNKKAPSLSKGRSLDSVLPPDVYRQLALPASSSTGAHASPEYSSTITCAGPVTAYWASAVGCEALRCIHDLLSMRLSSPGCFLYAFAENYLFPSLPSHEIKAIIGSYIIFVNGIFLRCNFHKVIL